MNEQPIWVLAVTPEGEHEPSLSLHASWAHAAAWLRTGWADGDYESLSDDEMIARLRESGVGVVIDAPVPHWTGALS